MTLEDYRQFYADEIRLAANLRSGAVADAFARVLREDFLGPGPWQICSGEQAALALALMGLGGMYTPTTEPRDLYHNVLVAIDPRDPELEAPLRQAFTDRLLLRLKSVRLDPHEKADSCLVHGRAICLSASGAAL